MIEVIDLAFHYPEPLIDENLSVQSLFDIDRPWRVVHDLTTRRSLVVDPQQVRALVDEFSFDPGASLAESPLVGLLAVGQMTAHARLPATPIVAMAEWQNVGYVIVEDDEHRPLGLLGVAHVREVLAGTQIMVDAGLGPTVEAWLSDGGLTRAVAELDASFGPGQFHSEDVNLTAPAAPWCDGATGHWVSECPCAPHPSAVCGRR